MFVWFTTGVLGIVLCFTAVNAAASAGGPFPAASDIWIDCPDECRDPPPRSFRQWFAVTTCYDFEQGRRVGFVTDTARRGHDAIWTPRGAAVSVIVGARVCPCSCRRAHLNSRICVAASAATRRCQDLPCQQAVQPSAAASAPAAAPEDGSGRMEGLIEIGNLGDLAAWSPRVTFAATDIDIFHSQTRPQAKFGAPFVNCRLR